MFLFFWGEGLWGGGVDFHEVNRASLTAIEQDDSISAFFRSQVRLTTQLVPLSVCQLWRTHQFDQGRLAEVLHKVLQVDYSWASKRQTRQLLVLLGGILFDDNHVDFM